MASTIRTVAKWSEFAGTDRGQAGDMKRPRTRSEISSSIHRRLSWRRNLSCSHPILSADRPVFYGFFRPPPSLARVPISKFPALSASSPASFLRLHSDVVLDETPDFRPFPARQASPTLGPNSSSDVPEGLITCRLGTQQPSLAPQNSGVQSHLSVPASYFGGPAAFWDS